MDYGHWSASSCLADRAGLRLAIVLRDADSPRKAPEVVAKHTRLGIVGGRERKRTGVLPVATGRLRSLTAVNGTGAESQEFAPW